MLILLYANVRRCYSQMVQSATIAKVASTMIKECSGSIATNLSTTWSHYWVADTQIHTSMDDGAQILKCIDLILNWYFPKRAIVVRHYTRGQIIPGTSYSIGMIEEIPSWKRVKIGCDPKMWQHIENKSKEMQKWHHLSWLNEGCFARWKWV